MGGLSKYRVHQSRESRLRIAGGSSGRVARRPLHLRSRTHQHQVPGNPLSLIISNRCQGAVRRLSDNDDFGSQSHGLSCCIRTAKDSAKPSSSRLLHPTTAESSNFFFSFGIATFTYTARFSISGRAIAVAPRPEPRQNPNSQSLCRLRL